MRLAAIAADIPMNRIDAEDIVRAAGGTTAEARVFKQLFGIEQVSASTDDASVTSNFEIILDQLAAEHAGYKPDAIIYVHGLPLQYRKGGSPVTELAAHPLLAQVRLRYEVDQYNCSGMFWALEMADSLLRSQTARAVVILAGDGHANLSLAERYVPGCTLMGEAYCGLVVDGEAGGWRFQPMALHVRPEFHFGRAGTSQQMSQFFSAHNTMVRAVLEQTGFDWSGRTPLLPHNVNRLVWKQFCRDCSLEFSRVNLNLLPDIGHCYTSDAFLLLSALLHDAKADYDTATLVSVGMGGFIGACELRNSAPLENGARG
jgi:3-oxoacyl-[acyl-carrier-protein] synthase III